MGGGRQIIVFYRHTSQVGYDYELTCAMNIFPPKKGGHALVVPLFGLLSIPTVTRQMCPISPYPASPPALVTDPDRESIHPHS